MASDCTIGVLYIVNCIAIPEFKAHNQSMYVPGTPKMYNFMTLLYTIAVHRILAVYK